MKRIVRITEQDLAKVLSDILNMTGIFGKDKMKSDSGSSSDSKILDKNVPNKTTSDDEFYKRVLQCI